MSASVLEQLRSRKEAIEVDLGKTEKRVYDLETSYLMAESSQCGTVLKAS